MERRVRLTVDLTKYDPRCVVGSEGVTGRPLSMWARGTDLCVGVYFDSGACLDVFWSGLTVIGTVIDGVLSDETSGVTS